MSRAIGILMGEILLLGEILEAIEAIEAIAWSPRTPSTEHAAR